VLQAVNNGSACLITAREAPDTTHEGGVTGHFCRVVRKQEEPIITGEQALTGLRIIKAIYESAKSGKSVLFH